MLLKKVKNNLILPLITFISPILTLITFINSQNFINRSKYVMTFLVFILSLNRVIESDLKTYIIHYEKAEFFSFYEFIFITGYPLFNIIIWLSSNLINISGIIFFSLIASISFFLIFTSYENTVGLYHNKERQILFVISAFLSLSFYIIYLTHLNRQMLAISIMLYLFSKNYSLLVTFLTISLTSYIHVFSTFFFMLIIPFRNIIFRYPFLFSTTFCLIISLLFLYRFELSFFVNLIPNDQIVSRIMRSEYYHYGSVSAFSIVILVIISTILSFLNFSFFKNFDEHNKITIAIITASLLIITFYFLGINEITVRFAPLIYTLLFYIFFISMLRVKQKQILILIGVFLNFVLWYRVFYLSALSFNDPAWAIFLPLGMLL